MPTRGKCWCCGETKMLFGTQLRKPGTHEIYFQMLCASCKRYFEQKSEIHGDVQG